MNSSIRVNMVCKPKDNWSIAKQELMIFYKIICLNRKVRSWISPYLIRHWSRDSHQRIWLLPNKSIDRWTLTISKASKTTVLAVRCKTCHQWKSLVFQTHNLKDQTSNNSFLNPTSNNSFIWTTKANNNSNLRLTIGLDSWIRITLGSWLIISRSRCRLWIVVASIATSADKCITVPWTACFLLAISNSKCNKTVLANRDWYLMELMDRCKCISNCKCHKVISFPTNSTTNQGSNSLTTDCQIRMRLCLINKTQI